MLQDTLSYGAENAGMRVSTRPPGSRIRMHDAARLKYNRELAERLAVARRGAAKSEKEVAQHLGVRLNSYLRWERGERQFPMHLVLPFCLLTGFAPSFIVTGLPNGDWKVGEDTGSFPVRKSASDR